MRDVFCILNWSVLFAALFFTLLFSALCVCVFFFLSRRCLIKILSMSNQEAKYFLLTRCDWSLYQCSHKPKTNGGKKIKCNMNERLNRRIKYLTWTNEREERENDRDCTQSGIHVRNCSHTCARAHTHTRARTRIATNDTRITMTTMTKTTTATATTAILIMLNLYSRRKTTTATK